jgi:hypothetical protein
MRLLRKLQSPTRALRAREVKPVLRLSLCGTKKEDGLAILRRRAMSATALSAFTCGCYSGQRLE